MLLQGLNNYDPERGALGGFLYVWIHTVINKAYARQHRTVAIPYNTYRKLYTYTQARQRLELQLGRYAAFAWDGWVVAGCHSAIPGTGCAAENLHSHSHFALCQYRAPTTAELQSATGFTAGMLQLLHAAFYYQEVSVESIAFAGQREHGVQRSSFGAPCLFPSQPLPRQW